MHPSKWHLVLVLCSGPVVALGACVGSEPVGGTPDAAVGPTTPEPKEASANPLDSSVDTSVDTSIPEASAPIDAATDAGPVFSPKSIPDLALWLDAEQGLAVQSNVNNWVDQVSLTAVRGDQAHGAGTCTPPQRIANEVKTHPVVRFNGTSTCLVLDDRFGGTFRDFTKGTSIFIVAKAGTSTGTRESLIDFSPGFGQSNDYFLLARDDQRAFHYVRNSSGPPFDDTSGSSASAFLAGEVHVVSAFGSAGAAASYLSGVAFQLLSLIHISEPTRPY